MKGDDPRLKPQYRMPRVFGALPGPRNVPKDRQHLLNRQRNLALSMTMLTDRDALVELLPPGCVLDGEPLLTLNALYMTNIGWLAGRGYALISAGFRIARDSPSQGRLTGNFLAVVWENMADPILTGREELGWAKLFAEIPDPIAIDTDHVGSAGWDGFRFLDFSIRECRETDPSPATASGSFHYKYVPETGALDRADVEYLEYSPPGAFATGYGGMTVRQRFTGRGDFVFHPARWEDIPFQYPIINALAALPRLEMREASVTISEADGKIGDPGGGALRKVT
ncbi:acetoacetate decarboxylase family protein [Sphingomonas sp.]|uniref:acetoacetate decarboxylase family protein n=1 Tax=Sphingomonas sp. TaxID=28214 RepID=UPI000DB385A6|nr:acetoacetate decarboxylase family protein [Sphingomonas sp.]PZU10987.1 MAG: hypothetical protein DI605_05115 [Sphingomonas sp.]